MHDLPEAVPRKKPPHTLQLVWLIPIGTAVYSMRFCSRARLNSWLVSPVAMRYWSVTV